MPLSFRLKSIRAEADVHAVHAVHSILTILLAGKEIRKRGRAVSRVARALSAADHPRGRAIACIACSKNARPIDSAAHDLS